MFYVNGIILIFFSVLTFYLIVLFIEIVKGKAPFISTNRKVIKKIIAEIDFIPQKALEMGCGQARFLRTLEKKYPDIGLVGIENDWWPIFLARVKNKLFNSNIRILKEDLFSYNTKDFDLVYLFLNIKSMEKLEKKIKLNFHSNQIIISYVFKFLGLEAIKKIRIGPFGEFVYIYKIL